MKNKGVFIAMGFDAARDFSLGDTGQHFGVRAWRLGTKIAVIGGKIAKYSAMAFIVPKESSNPSNVHENVP